MKKRTMTQILKQIICLCTVSYTHLDVYKRQTLTTLCRTLLEDGSDNGGR